MPALQGLLIHQTILILLLNVYAAACIACALVTFMSFLLYVRARMANREKYPADTAEQHTRRVRELDRREERYRSIHFITLALFVLFGVLILVHLSNKLNGAPQHF